MRESRNSSALRAYNASVWGVIMTTDDSKAMQTITARGLNGELFGPIQRPQVYGHNSLPVPPDNNGGSAAEVVIGFRDGNRAHPFIIAEGDRRTRPKNGEAGQSGLWHYKGAGLTLTTAGQALDAGPEKKPHTFTCGNAVVTVVDGKITLTVDQMTAVVKPDAVYLGGDPDKGGNFQRVMLESGPTNLVKGKMG